jgi:MFS family permease
MENPAVKTSFFRKWGGLFVISLALAIIILDSTIVNVSLGPITRDLNTDIKSLRWVIAVYALVLGAFTIGANQLGESYGRKKVFLLGAVIFAAGSAVASLSHNLTLLLIGGAIIGLGAALIMPATASLLTAGFQGREKAIAFGIWAGVAYIFTAGGPILNGFLTTYSTWRWAFRMNAIIAVILLLGAVLFKESRGEDRKLLNSPPLVSGAIIVAILGLVSAALFFIFPAFFYTVRGLDALHIGLALLPLALGVLVMAGVTAALGQRISSKRVVQTGFIFQGLGLIVLHRILSVNATAWGLAPGLFICGLGLGLIMPHVGKLAMTGKDSGVNDVMRQLGGALGVALIGASVLTHTMALPYLLIAIIIGMLTSLWLPDIKNDHSQAGAH